MPLEIQSVKFFKQFVILKFKGIDNINDIEKYKRCSLYVTREHAVALEEDEYFIADMIGMEVMHRRWQYIRYIKRCDRDRRQRCLCD